ncbi:hypothetical protein ABIE52_000558 [Rhodococcus sp. OAS809]|jgi:hypothetical protein
MTGEVCSKGRKSFRRGNLRFVCEYFIFDVSRYCDCRGAQLKLGRFSGVDVLSRGWRSPTLLGLWVYASEVLLAET